MSLHRECAYKKKAKRVSKCILSFENEGISQNTDVVCSFKWISLVIPVQIDCYFKFNPCLTSCVGCRPPLCCLFRCLAHRSHFIEDNYGMINNVLLETNKTKPAGLFSFPDRSHYCLQYMFMAFWTAIWTKGRSYKGLMNGMHLLQLFRSRFKHRVALNYKTRFSQEDERIYCMSLIICLGYYTK